MTPVRSGRRKNPMAVVPHPHLPAEGYWQDHRQAGDMGPGWKFTAKDYISKKWGNRNEKYG